jgi:Na+-transporting NADH:ubiquinone oxidoreductase subunit NqrC
MFKNNKNQRIVSTIIIVVLVLAMVGTVLVSALSY